jgi:plasmid stabilization system protein ParE
MSLRLVISQRARTQIREIIDWWRVNRPAAARRVPIGLKQVLRRIVESPNAAERYETPRGTVRRCRIPKTPYHVYYRVGADIVSVAAVWSAKRGSGPPLGR